MIFFFCVFPFCQCVKALVYYDLQTCHLDVQNDKGDTALHMAARWGYEGIIQVLMENGASSTVCNRSKESPLHCALNPKVSQHQRRPLWRACRLTYRREKNLNWWFQMIS